MTLTKIIYGSLASSEIMNNNFQYLDDKISNLSNTVSSNQASISSNIASINSTLHTFEEKNTKEIKDLQNRIYLIKTYINGNSGFRLYSDNYCEQWGKIHTDSNPCFISLIKEYNSINYQITFISEGSNQRAYTQGVQNITTNSFSINSGYATNEGVSSSTYGINILWHTSGYTKEGV